MCSSPVFLSLFNTGLGIRLLSLTKAGEMRLFSSGGSSATFGLVCALSVGGRPIISFHTSSHIARSRSVSLR
ncbi:MAG: hypothetical protein PHW93_06850 [Candidatus Methanomethylophilaceae archaeon]|nr:hypothetical protein [Candidatus Methanomethylophilaceae archaeon]